VQQILIEEGAKNELEGLRVTPAWNETGVPKNIAAGLILQEFTPEMKEHEFNVAVMQHVIPGFVKRVGGPDTDIVRLFNEKVGPIVGITINPDSSVTQR
jgi:hypothetical protein